MKTIAFSILNRNGLDDTINCIDSLLQSDMQDFDIYLLDNGSQHSEEFIELTKHYQQYQNIFLHRSDINLGFTGGNNYNLKCIQHKSYDFICLLNNDCIIQPGCITDIIYKIKVQQRPGIFGPVIRNPNGSIQSCGSLISLRTGSNPRLNTIVGDYRQVDCISGSCFIISREVFQKVGLLDDQYFAYREESDYCMRARKLGYSIISLNSEGVIHKEETAQNKKKTYYTYLMFRNRILFLRKYATTPQYIVSWGVLIVYMIVIFPRVFGLGNYKHARKGIVKGTITKLGK